MSHDHLIEMCEACYAQDEDGICTLGLDSAVCFAEDAQAAADAMRDD